MIGKEVLKPLSLKAPFLGLVHPRHLLQHKAPVITQQHLSLQLLNLSLCPAHKEGTVAVARYFTSLKLAEYWKWSPRVPPLCPHPMKSLFPIVSQMHLQTRRDYICT